MSELIDIAEVGYDLTRYEAEKCWQEYRDAVAKWPDQKEYQELEAAYHQRKMGRKVVSLANAMRFAGVNASGQPMLAIAGATARWCYFVPDAGRINERYWNHPAVAFVSEYDQNPGWRKRGCLHSTDTCFRFLRDWFPTNITKEIRAQVPIVPPRYRPKAKLSNYHILWEANWDTAPQDPYLLRRITDDLFVVLAEWDLTPAEMTIMEASIV